MRDPYVVVIFRLLMRIQFGGNTGKEACVEDCVPFAVRR
jgi:hypothetical protein